MFVQLQGQRDEKKKYHKQSQPRNYKELFSLANSMFHTKTKSLSKYAKTKVTPKIRLCFKPVSKATYRQYSFERRCNSANAQYNEHQTISAVISYSRAPATSQV